MFKKDFYNNRQFACEHFYAWENGEDFDWLKKEWHKFEPYLTNKKEVQDFILTLAHIYNSFCHEAYFAETTNENAKKYEWLFDFVEKDPLKAQIEKERVIKNLDKTLDIILKTYEFPNEIARQFVSIAIGFELSNNDGIKYIFDLCRDKWNPDKEIEPIF